MPIYEYVCLKCNEKFSVLQSIFPSDRETKCPKCVSNQVKKTISSFSCASNSENSASVSTPPTGFKGGG